MQNLTKATNELIYKTEIRVADVGNKLVVTRGKAGCINCKTGLDIHIPIYIKQTTNKDRVYSTGNSTQYSVMLYMGKES